VLALAGLLGLGLLVWQTQDDGQSEFQSLAPEDPGPVHVHGLGINPADGALFIATHTGLYRVDKDERAAERVSDDYQDTMGFTVVGPNRFLGSGHPDLNQAGEQGLPPLLGLIESTDSGKNWKQVSLLGEADFHVLRFADARVYGYDASNDRLLVSSDQGRNWEELRKPGPLIDLTVDPADPEHLLATSEGGLEEGLFESRDGGQSWDNISRFVGILAWPSPGRLFLIAAGGLVFRSPDARNLDHVGQIGGEPAALLAHSPSELYVALHDGTIKQSDDAGTTWTVRSTPS
jgi:photosystem II stability/assembly factor-like uncharacterized protein